MKDLAVGTNLMHVVDVELIGVFVLVYNDSCLQLEINMMNQ
jgi:hypothetical protein